MGLFVSLAGIKRDQRCLGLQAGLLVGPLPPVVPEQFHRVGCPYAAISTAQVIGGTVFLASPTDALRIFRVSGEALHWGNQAIVCMFRTIR